MEEKLTIIIPCFNSENTITETIESIYTQNIDIPFEIIMVDDKSTDKTLEVIKKLSQKHQEIKIIKHNKNNGGGATRNTAVSNSSGNIIFCLDSDDLLPADTLPKMYKYMDKKKCDGVSVYKSIKFSGNDRGDIDHVDVSPYSDKKIPFISLFTDSDTFNPLEVNFMYTRQAFNKIGGYPTEHGFDTQGFCWRFLCSGLTAYTCPNTSYLHRINFKESYYLREYNTGKINFNWRDILLENYFVFNNDTIDFILKFNCQDFSKNLMEEVKKRDCILARNHKHAVLKKHPPLKLPKLAKQNIKRNSIRGYCVRIKKIIMELFHKKR